MKVLGKTELEKIEVQKTYAEEYGIYFIGGNVKRLAFAYSSAKRAISSVKKVAEVLNVQYNIVAEVQIAALNEKEEDLLTSTIDSTKCTERGTTKMANDKKRNVNVKQLCRDCITSGMTETDTKAKIAAVYVEEGKDAKYAAGRAKAVYGSITKELGTPKVTPTKVTTTPVVEVVTPTVVTAPVAEVEEATYTVTETETDDTDTTEEVEE